VVDLAAAKRGLAPNPSNPAFAFVFRRYAPFARFGGVRPHGVLSGFGSFAGDNRGPSTSWEATSRTYCWVIFDRSGILEHRSSSSGTHFHPLIGAVVTGHTKVKHTVVPIRLAGPFLFRFRASTSGNNPLVTGSPDINTYVDARIDFGTPGLLKVYGETFGDNFPNLEVFVVCLRSRRTALLFDGRTTGGPNAGPAVRLIGEHERHSLGIFQASLALDPKGELEINYLFGPRTLPDYE